MRMSGDEEVGMVGDDTSPGSFVVVSGIASDMGYQYAHLFAFEEAEFRPYDAQGPSVGISAYGIEGFEGGYLIREFDGPDVACVPYLIRFGQKIT